jgi:hypothetical protein
MFPSQRLNSEPGIVCPPSRRLHAPSATQIANMASTTLLHTPQVVSRATSVARQSRQAPQVCMC